jgi:hypothetical protein
MAKLRMVCAECGSDNVLADAYAAWNFEAQCWEVHGDVFDKGSVCEECDGECSIESEEVETE